jgi:hypothetical protein
MAIAGTPPAGRNEPVRHLMMTLQPNPRLEGIAADVSGAAYDLALRMLQVLADGPELSAGLRKLREAKDCLVIQGLADSGAIRPVADSGLYALTQVSCVHASHRCGRGPYPSRKEVTV